MWGRKRAAHADIWRQPYSEKELRSSGFELACEDGRARYMPVCIKNRGAQDMNSLNIEQIQEIIPHRHPFLLLDKIEDYEPGRICGGI